VLVAPRAPPSAADRALFSCHARAPGAFVWSEVTMLGFMRAGGFNMWVLVALALPTLWTAIRFARNADPHRLSILRALTLALAFAALTGWVSNLVATARFVVGDPEALRDPVPPLLTGFAEACANLILGGGILVVTWILVAVGVRRMPADP
jgi:hypothetical protein